MRFLADRYGEDKLWKLMHVQARSIFFPLWVNLRFWQAYDKTLSTLIDEFADEMAANLPDRARPPEQRVLRAAGNSARYARAPDGTEALLAADLDRPAWLAVYGARRAAAFGARLTDVLPPRKLAIAAPTLASGLSFSPDGRCAVLRRAGSGSDLPGGAPLPLRRRRRDAGGRATATCAAAADR